MWLPRPLQLTPPPSIAAAGVHACAAAPQEHIRQGNLEARMEKLRVSVRPGGQQLDGTAVFEHHSTTSREHKREQVAGCSGWSLKRGPSSDSQQLASVQQRLMLLAA